MIAAVCHINTDRDYGDSALRVLADDVMRPFLLQRLIVQHILKTVCDHDGWKGFREDTDDELDEIEKGLAAVDSKLIVTLLKSPTTNFC